MAKKMIKRISKPLRVQTRILIKQDQMKIKFSPVVMVVFRLMKLGRIKIQQPRFI